MAVYTQVSDEALAEFLSAYDLGVALAFKGIAEGVENSNYYLETEKGRFILTLFEKRVNAAELPYFIGLKQHLAAKGYPCPEPVMGRDGSALRTLEGRPAVIITFLDGLSPRRPNVRQCRALGEGLAKMHLALADFAGERENSLGPKAWAPLWLLSRSSGPGAVLRTCRAGRSMRTCFRIMPFSWATTFPAPSTSISPAPMCWPMTLPCA